MNEACGLCGHVHDPAAPCVTRPGRARTGDGGNVGAQPPPVRTLRGRYELRQPIGRGGMGEVFHGFDRELERDVAVKLLSNVFVTDPLALERFSVEAKRTVAHPHIVSVTDVGRDETSGQPFFVMELLDGERLDKVLQRAGQMPLDRALRIVSQILLALAEAHRRVVHRDLKPANVMLVRMGEVGDFVKILDFGVARALGGVSITQDQIAIGTPRYMAPEVASGRAREAGPEADLYAVGLILFELLVGEAAWAGLAPDQALAVMAAGQMPPPITTRRPDLPRWLDAVLAKALAPDPAKRFRSASEFRAALLEPHLDVEELPAGTIVAGAYEIERKIGQGGFAVVYLARELEVGRRCALKLLVPRAGDDEEVVSRFRRDAMLAARIDHPAVVRVFSAGQWEGHRWIAMEYVTGGTLREAWASLGWPDLLQVLRQVAEALDAIHAAGVVHRDLSPENILVDQAGRVRVVDFGIARPEDSNLTTSATDWQIGRLGYVAPEQLLDPRRVSPATDQWALAAIVYEALTGLPPFRKAAEHLETPTGEQEIAARIMDGATVESARGANSAVTPELDGILMRALARAPEGRFPSASAFVVGLEAADGRGVRLAAGQGATASQGTAAAGPASAVQVALSAARPSRAGVLAVASAAVVAAIAAVAVAWARWGTHVGVAPAGSSTPVDASDAPRPDRAPSPPAAVTTPDAGPDVAELVTIVVESEPAGAVLETADGVRLALPSKLRRPRGTRLAGVVKLEGHAPTDVEVLFDIEGRHQSTKLRPAKRRRAATPPPEMYRRKDLYIKAGDGR